WKGWAILLRQKQKKLIMLPSETMIWQPEFTDKTLSRKPGAVQRDYISIMPKLVVCFLWSSLCSVLRKNILEPVEQMNAWIRGAINKKKKWK
ncbi:hypothetical protein, partial [Escherichia coli]|uniref:hypothetical protein n=1 Tax=Escherichia coli TaxID=562 RepID=UPI00196BA92F